MIQYIDNQSFMDDVDFLLTHKEAYLLVPDIEISPDEMVKHLSSIHDKYFSKNEFRKFIYLNRDRQGRNIYYHIKYIPKISSNEEGVSVLKKGSMYD